MSKRKAIEAALSRWNKVRKEDSFTSVDVEDVIVGAAVERAYDAGRIAGLREAAALWICSPEACRERANVLAKKARASSSTH